MKEILTTRPEITLNGTVFRKEIMKFGKYRHPNPVFGLDPDYDWEFDKKDAGLLVKNFKAGHVESVKLLHIHDEEEARKVGVVTELRVTKTGVDAIIDVEDEKVIEGILTLGGDGKPLEHGVSSGIDSRFPNADATTRDKYVKGPVLRHVALATIPWVQGMRDWEMVEEALALNANVLPFGHEDYTGEPLIHEDEFEEEDDNMKTKPVTKAQKAALKILAANSDKTEDELAKLLGLEEKEEEDDSPLGQMTKILTTLSATLGNKSDDDDDDDEDDEDDKKNKGDKDDGKLAASVVKAAERIVAGQNKETKATLTTLTDSVALLATQLKASNRDVEDTKTQQSEEAAKTAVTLLVNGGKVLPADREHYETLHLHDTKLFDSLTKKLEVLVDFDGDDHQEDPFEGNPMGGMTPETVTSETDRYMNMVTPQVAGKQDSPKSDGRVDA